MASRFKYRPEWIAGAFLQPITGAVNSFTGVNVGSEATVERLIGAGQWRGIANITSGTTVVSVSALAADSGMVIQTTIYMYGSVLSSQAGVTTAVQSVRAGAFEIVCVGSLAPIANMPVAWSVIR